MVKKSNANNDFFILSFRRVISHPAPSVFVIKNDLKTCRIENLRTQKKRGTFSLSLDP